ncbi:DNA repair protein RadC [Pseudorhodobacter sp. W20_MBD10_FR17]|uniref:DNA repair protein RadC n=1 Tax=Pseudorhodobacter sp. W20_MBD10_FR17 TaxID=3240266 RepID=UPI003F943836
MFDFALPIQPISRSLGCPPCFATRLADPSLPFALTIPCRTPAAVMSGQAGPTILNRFATLAEAMQAAITYADEVAQTSAPQLLAILDRDERLVLAGSVRKGAVAWCHPVTNAAEARAIVTEASQLRAQASRATDWREPDLAERLRHCADVLEARLVDPLWRSFAIRSLQIAA